MLLKRRKNSCEGEVLRLQLLYIDGCDYAEEYGQMTNRHQAGG